TLTNVSQLALGPDGSIYFSEIDANRIRHFTIGGTITTVAGNGRAGYSGDGGPATQASLNSPFGVAVDQNGIVFISDTSNAVVCGTYASFPGGFGGEGGPATLAQLACPSGIDSDASGRIYLVDQFGACVRRFTIGGTINVVCGDPLNPAPSTAENVPATSTTILGCRLSVDRTTDTVYFSELTTGANRVRGFVEGGNIQTVAGQ